MRTLTIAAALGGAIALSGCAEEAGDDITVAVYGEATRANFVAQEGYAGSDAFLINMSEAFRAETDEVVTFAFDRATLDAAARRALDGQAAWLLAHPEVRMSIVGHTDLVGSESYNYGLGLRRAQAVLEYLVARGVPRERLVALESFGEEQPLVPTTQRERRNRRAVTMVSGFAAGYGPGLDGVYAERIYDLYQAGQLRVTEAESTVAAP